jgi:hypothetical protein
MAKPYQQYYSCRHSTDVCTTYERFVATVYLHFPFYNLHACEDRTRGTAWVHLGPEAEFLDVIGTKVSRVFLLGIHSHLTRDFTPPSPLAQK